MSSPTSTASYSYTRAGDRSSTDYSERSTGSPSSQRSSFSSVRDVSVITDANRQGATLVAPSTKKAQGTSSSARPPALSPTTGSSVSPAANTHQTAKKSAKVSGNFFRSPAFKALALVLLGVGLILAIHFGATHISTFHHLPLAEQALIKKISESAAGILFIAGPANFLRKRMIHQFAMDATFKHQTKETTSVKNKVTGEIEEKSSHWYNEIAAPTFDEVEGVTTPEHLPRILLSMIPLKNEDPTLSEDEKETREDTSMIGTLLEKENVTRILSANEAYENDVVGKIARPVTDSDWKDKYKFKTIPLNKSNYKGSKTRLRLPAKDYEPMKLDHLKEGVRFIEASETGAGTTKKDTVDVHCKAGRGRSAALVGSYFLKTFYASYRAKKLEDPRFSPVDSVIKHLREQRAWVTIGPDQRNAIADYWNDLIKQQGETHTDLKNLKETKMTVSVKKRAKNTARSLMAHGLLHTITK